MENLEKQFDRIERGEHMVKQVIEKDYVSFGTPLLDIITGGGAGPFGAICNLIGDSGSGKTILATEIAYQALKKFKDKVHLRYLDKESSYSFDTMSMYGFDMKDYFTENVHTIEDFGADIGNFAKRIPNGHYGLYIVDSWDALASDEEMTEMDDRMKAHEKGKDYDKKSYGMERAKFSSKFFRTIVKKLEENNVLLVVISQIRDNPNGGLYGPKFQITGGKALKFYSSQRLFLKTREKYEKQDRLIGYTAEVEALKSRCRFPLRKMYVNLLTEFGVDDVGTAIDYLYELRNDYGKMKSAEIVNNIKWKEDSVEVSSTTLKEFLEQYEKMEDAEDWITTNSNGRKSQKNLLEYIQQDPELAADYVDYFGIIDRDSLIQYVVQREMEDEINEKAINKWLAVEEKIRPVRAKKRL